MPSADLGLATRVHDRVHQGLHGLASPEWSGPGAGSQLIAPHCPAEEAKGLLGWDVHLGGRLRRQQ